MSRLTGKPLPADDPLVRVEASLLWEAFPQNGSVYLAMAFGVGKKMERQGTPGRECSAGYMGGQIHEDGSHRLLFSLWDWNATLHTAFGVKPLTTDNGKTGCSAFGGEGTGGHCGAPLAGDDFMWEVGTRYTFAAVRVCLRSNYCYSPVFFLTDGIVRCASVGRAGRCYLPWI
eukprot:COSAG02_NODE_3490_length_6660_cov_5.207285_6_plen_173_part_00